MNRKTVLALPIIGVLALAGCSGSADSSSGGSGDGLTWSMWIGSTEDQQAWEAVGDAGAEAIGQPINLQGAPFVDYWTKLSTQLGTSNAPCIVSMQSLRLNQFTDGLLPLNDLLADSDVNLDEFDEGALAALAKDGEQYALPYDTGPMVLFYNKDMFDAAGVEAAPGWTVDDFETAAEKLKGNGQVALGTTVEDLFLESALLAYNGAEAITADGDINLDDPKVAEAVDWMAGLVTEGYGARANGPDGSADDNAFIGGGVASIIGGPWMLLDLDAKSDFTLGVTTLPVGPDGGQTYSAGSGFGVSSTCDDPEGALEAIVAMTSDDVLTTLAENGRAFPARIASQNVWYDESGIEGVDVTFEEALAQAIPLPGSESSDQLNQLLAQYGAQMINGDRPAGDVLADISAQLQN
jgi:multiple sugar transport system substrate-binding protein